MTSVNIRDGMGIAVATKISCTHADSEAVKVFFK